MNLNDRTINNSWNYSGVKNCPGGHSEPTFLTVVLDIVDIIVSIHASGKHLTKEQMIRRRLPTWT